MTAEEIDRIKNAINHIQTATDVDPWAVEIAVDAMRKQIPQKPKDEPEDSPLHHKRCPSCNKILTMYDWQMPCCKKCGQAIDWKDE